MRTFAKNTVRNDTLFTKMPPDLFQVIGLKQYLKAMPSVIHADRVYESCGCFLYPYRDYPHDS